LIEAPLLGVYTIAFSARQFDPDGGDGVGQREHRVFRQLSEVLRERPQDLAGDDEQVPAPGATCS